MIATQQRMIRRSAAAPSRAGKVAVPASVRSLAYSSRVQLTSWDRESFSLADAMPSTSGAAAGAPRRQVVRMGNKATTGPFAPLVVVVRNIVGEKDFNKIRGKAISLHSQVIKDFCKLVGADNKQCQGVIRLAKKNGEWLGFLA